MVSETVVEAVVEAVVVGHLIVNTIVVGALILGSGVCCTINTGASTLFAGLIFDEAIVEAVIVGRLIVDAIVVGTLVARIVITCVVVTEDGRGRRGSCRAVPCPFLPGLGSGLAGLAADGRSPFVRDLIELLFHNFLSLLCQCGTRHCFLT